jgi:hypothetical protein
LHKYLKTNLAGRMPSRKKRTRSVTRFTPAEPANSKRRKTDDDFTRNEDDIVLPETQSALQLHAIRQPYKVTKDHETPTMQNDFELLVKVQAVGLNPIDWKAP